ncbi:hypothetical protein BC834DRAFT_841982 [Gloeopeniophorella convolvens]|nr:hypothetical protein BC834DRAFT_841982 [Gloeopeniophorella convolvens]
MISAARPLLRLDIPTSPLLSSLPSNTVFASDPPACAYTTISPERIPSPALARSISSSTASSFTLHPCHSVPEITITRPLSESISKPSLRHSPPVSLPRKARLSPAASKKLVEFIDLLEKIDRDMAAEVQHVKESIKEARTYVDEWQEERRVCRAELLKKREREKRETKEPDSDFWLGI